MSFDNEDGISLERMALYYNDHEETYRFINEMEFDRLGVFAYSAEEGTPAYDMTPQTDGDVKEFRRAELYELQQAEIARQREIIARYRMYNREKSIRAAESRDPLIFAKT